MLLAVRVTLPLVGVTVLTLVTPPAWVRVAGTIVPSLFKRDL